MTILDSKLTCPKCGCEAPLTRFQLSEEVLEISRLAARFGKIWPWVEEYLHCFRSALDKPLKPSRMKLILEEILKFIDQGGFNIDKHWHVVRPNAIYEGLKYVALKNKVGFRNHHYLMRVAISINQQMIEKDESDQKKKETEAFQRFQRDPNMPTRIKDILGKLK